MPRHSAPFTLTNPSSQESEALVEFQRLLHPQLKFIDAEGNTRELPPSLYELLKQGTNILVSGDTLYQDALERQLSPQEAAQLLDVSRTFLLKLLDQNEIPFTMVGTHRRLQLSNVLDYKKRQGIRAKIGSNERNTQFQSLIERSRAITFISSYQEKLEFLYISPQIQYLLGYTPQDFITNADLYRELIAPEDLQRLRNVIPQNNQTDTPFNFDIRIQTKAGKWCWIRCEGFALQETTHTLFEGILVDITDRKLAETNLAEHEIQLRRIIEHSADGISLTDEQGRIVEWNKAIETITGIPKSLVIGQPLDDIIFQLLPDNRKTEQAHQAIRNAIKGIIDAPTPPNRCWEVTIQRPDGGIRHLENQYFPIKTEKGQMACAFCRDITQKKNSETSVITALERSHAALNQIPGMVWISGLDGKCRYVNQAWLNYTGKALEDEIGDAWMDNIHPADLNPVLTSYLKAFHFREKYEMDFRLRRHDGKYQMVQLCGQPFLDSNQNFTGYIALCREIAVAGSADQK